MASVAEKPDQAQQAGEDQEPGTPEEAGSRQQEAGTVLDRHKEYMDTQVQRASQWVDGFFADSNYDAEAANSQFRFRPELYYRDEQGAEVNLKVGIRLELPNLNRKISLVIGTDEDEDQSGQFIDDSDGHSIAGLQFLLRDSAHWHTSIVAGFRFNDSALFIGPRFRYQTSLTDKTMARFTQTFRWQTDNHWDIGSRADLYYVLNEHLYFRQTLQGRWRDNKYDEEGLQIKIGSILSQRLSETAGLQYDFSTIVHTEPDTHVDKYTLSLRYRKQTPKEWLYYEIAPQVSFEDQFDYKANPGIRLRLELYYGQTGSSHFWEHNSDASEE